jgi:hypothetical protein
VSEVNHPVMKAYWVSEISEASDPIISRGRLEQGTLIKTKTIIDNKGQV